MSDNTPTLMPTAERAALNRLLGALLKSENLGLPTSPLIGAIYDRFEAAGDVDPMRPPRPENASSAPRSPHTGFEGARLRSASLEREGVGLGRITLETEFTNVSPEVIDIIVGIPIVDLDALQSLAQAATPGLWEVNDDDDQITLDKGTALTRWNNAGTVGYPARSWNSVDRLVEIDPEDYTEDEVESVTADLQYIAAARPEVMLVMIERLRRAEAALAALTTEEKDA